ncbi:hypothetical protein H5410_052666 [Solanum commersonii]|uniref:Uncharacterized protein n=1 Tax=Solanum commersonii TaxID=4109 RepID=A0A9J5X2T8_SOLCO|nr:hypothetical protein H5410_052666 [Solanum commersonii]
MERREMETGADPEILEHDSGWAALQMNNVVSMQTHEED